jgi:eukaryotic-like serine/threonine-protein kinase
MPQPKETNCKMTEPIILSNRYILEKPLGRGGMATVYQARDRMLERTIAIKLLRSDYSSDLDFRNRFHQEAKAAANLVHPNIVTVHDFGMDGGRLYIVMEFVPGTDLNTLLHKRGRFTVDETLPLIRQACAGIGYAHRAGLVHCDIKPHNFLITPDNRVKVTDFGIARALEEIAPQAQNGVVWGSPQYFSPEQASGKPPTPASDVYSLGVVLYYMLTGRLPFTASTAAEIAHMHRFDEPPDPIQYNPSIPPALAAVVLKVLSKESSQRYRTADQLGRVLMSLEAATKNETVGVNRTPNFEKEDKPSSMNLAASSKLEDAAQGYLRTRQTETPKSPIRSVTTGPDSSFKKSTAPMGQTSEDQVFDIDWITLSIGLFALITVGGLIPLWAWIYLLYFPPSP